MDYWYILVIQWPMKMTLGKFVFALTASGLFAGCQGPVAHNLPPASRLMHPGPGVGGPGPGVIPPMTAMQPGLGVGVSSQVAFLGANGMQILYDVTGQGTFQSDPLVVPARQNFPQAAIYRLKLLNIPGRPGVELYPTLEVGPTTPRTDAFLAHAPIPVSSPRKILNKF